jgi:hypothetical protein
VNSKRLVLFGLLLTVALAAAGCTREASPPPTPTPTPKPVLESRVSVDVFPPQTTLGVGEETIIVVQIENLSVNRTINFEELRVSLPTNFYTAFVVTEMGDCDIDPGVFGRLQGIDCNQDFSVEPGGSAQFWFPIIAKTAGNYEGVLHARVTARPDYSGSASDDEDLNIIIIP